MVLHGTKVFPALITLQSEAQQVQLALNTDVKDSFEILFVLQISRASLYSHIFRGLALFYLHLPLISAPYPYNVNTNPQL